LDEGTVEAFSGKGTGPGSPELSSPWDVCIGPMPNMAILQRLAKEEDEHLGVLSKILTNGAFEDVLYVALAGEAIFV
jgi:hypothetical protein